ncbi:hypothetical protein V3C99_000144 [Haemonchus contortus]
MWNQLLILLLILLFIDEAIPKHGRELGGLGAKGRAINVGTELERSPRSWAPCIPSVPHLPSRPGLPPHRRQRLRSPPRPRMQPHLRGFGVRPRPMPARPSKSET